MKKIFLTIAVAAVFVCMLVISASAAAPLPSKPSLDYDFGEVTTIDGFNPPSQLYVNTDERVLLTDGNGGYVTYPTYYVTKDSDTFDMDFSKLNEAQSVEYSKKSVVMLEIPDGVKAIKQSYFAGNSTFPLCVSVQVPGSVTSYGAYMFQTNTVIEAVEFLDGTEPVTMGDGMFSSNWAEGTTKLEYVRFPNNLVSIGNSTFGKSHANKTIILGANLQSIGTGFFGESTPDGKDTFVYVSENFFKNTEMFSNLFGGYDQYHNNYLRITLFYTGSMEQAQAFADKGLAVQTGYVWSNLKMVSATDYVYAADKPGRNSLTLVYDFGKCDAFYGGHSYTGEEKVIASNYFETIKIGDTCSNCGEETVVSTIAPIFEWKGYSACTYGDTLSITQGYAVNHNSIEAYKVYAPDFDFGILVTVNIDGEAIAPKLDDENVLTSNFDKKKHSYIDVKVTGIPMEHEDTLIVMCVYVVANEKMFYLDGEMTGETVMGVSYSDALNITAN